MIAVSPINAVSPVFAVSPIFAVSRSRYFRLVSLGLANKSNRYLMVAMLAHSIHSRAIRNPSA